MTNESNDQSAPAPDAVAETRRRREFIPGVAKFGARERALAPKSLLVGYLTFPVREITDMASLTASIKAQLVAAKEAKVQYDFIEGRLELRVKATQQEWGMADKARQ